MDTAEVGIELAVADAECGASQPEWRAAASKARRAFSGGSFLGMAVRFRDRCGAGGSSI
jgi:hypothetical protein